ncbi:uncharacterized protein TM35_000511030, partial [Trypanosoma theileri]
VSACGKYADLCRQRTARTTTTTIVTPTVNAGQPKAVMAILGDFHRELDVNSHVFAPRKDSKVTVFPGDWDGVGDIAELSPGQEEKKKQQPPSPAQPQHQEDGHKNQHQESVNDASLQRGKDGEGPQSTVHPGTGLHGSTGAVLPVGSPGVPVPGALSPAPVSGSVESASGGQLESDVNSTTDGTESRNAPGDAQQSSSLTNSETTGTGNSDTANTGNDTITEGSEATNNQEGNATKQPSTTNNLETGTASEANAANTENGTPSGESESTGDQSTSTTATITTTTTTTTLPPELTNNKKGDADSSSSISSSVWVRVPLLIVVT